MVSTSKQFRQIKVTDENHPINQKIIQLLSVKPDKKKEIANEVGCQLAYVHRVYKYYFKHNQEEYDKLVEQEVNTVEEAQEEKEEIINTEPLFDDEVELRGSKNARISDDLKLAILEYVQNHTVQETCEKFKVSNYSVYVFCKEYGVKPYRRPPVPGNKNVIIIGKEGDNMNRKGKRNKINTPQKSIEEIAYEAEEKEKKEQQVEQDTIVPVEEEIAAPVKENTIKIGELEFIKERYQSAVNAALIYDRHLMPVSTGIFIGEIDKEHLFDYEWYDGAVKNWLFCNIPMDEHNVPEKRLFVYVTGLPAAVASVIKCCSSMKINLSLMHYNYERKSFVKQDIWTDFPMSRVETGLAKLFEGDIVNSVSPIKEYEQKSQFYVITKKKMTGSAKAGNAYYQTIEHFVVPDLATLWKAFPSLVEEIQADTTDKLCLFCNEVLKDNNDGFFFGKSIVKSWNFNMNI